jgi:hypothetical protein
MFQRDPSQIKLDKLRILVKQTQIVDIANKIFHRNTNPVNVDKQDVGNYSMGQIKWNVPQKS